MLAAFSKLPIVSPSRYVDAGASFFVISEWLSRSSLIIKICRYICMCNFFIQVREEDEEIEADGANYQLEMMRCLREVNVDNNTVGW